MAHATLLALLLWVVGSALPGPALAYEKKQLSLPPPPGALTMERLDAMAQRILDKGVARDGIPPIDKPLFISVTDANLGLEPQDHVFVLEDVSPPRIYPQRTLVWHVVVNEVDGVGPAKVHRSITYCPLTGSVAAYYGHVGDVTTTFGTDGGLLDNNTLLYDRATGSIWTQLTGLCIKGPLQGSRLQSIPLLWTTYERAAAKYPNAQVLSRATGHKRDYTKDPYGSYTRNGTYYDNTVLVNPVAHTSKDQHPKEKILGLILPDMLVAVVKKSLRHAGAANFDAGAFPIVAFWDESLQAPRLYDRRVDGQRLAFASLPQGIYDNATQTRWSPMGEGLEGKMAGVRLKRLATFEAMWYAWYSFFPESKLYDWSPALERETMRIDPMAVPAKLDELLRNQTAGNQGSGGQTP